MLENKEYRASKTYLYELIQVSDVSKPPAGSRAELEGARSDASATELKT